MGQGWRDDLAAKGFALLPRVYPPARVAELLSSLEATFARGETTGTMRTPEGAVYGARNLLDLWPGVRDSWRQEALVDALVRVLGPGCGLVRVLYFDKPPEQTWALPWHKDITIAVADNTLPSALFRKPTRKAGVPHVEAPCAVLQEMLTARIHLDDCDESNGALQVLPGTHTGGKELVLQAEPILVRAARGDVLLMRPLLTHASGRSTPDTPRHRRILHLEFAATVELPDGYRWHSFFPCLRQADT